MSKFLNPRATRAVAGLAMLSAFAIAPMAAQAADSSEATGTLTAGQLTNSAPDFDPFGANLTGITQTVNTPVGEWTVADATGSDDGYNVTVAATVPTVDFDGAATGSSPVAILGTSLKLYATQAANVANLNTPPVPAAAQQLEVVGPIVASTIQTAAAGTGQGPWTFPADTGATTGLEVVIPGTANPGAYSSTLTYTAAAPIA